MPDSNPFWDYMKRLPAQKLFLQKAGYHGSGHKILGVNFGNSILNNNDSNKINDYINKKIIFETGTEWDSLRKKNIFCQNYSQIFIVSKYTKKEIEKRTNDFL